MWRQVLSQAKDASQDGKDLNPVLQIPPNSEVEGFDAMLRQGRSLSGNERNCCFISTLATTHPSDRFANVSAVSGLDFPDDGRAVARVDWDHDGDLDLWISNRNAPRLRLLRNDTPSGNRSLQIRLVGNGTNTNINGVGARVTVVLESTSESQAARPMIKTRRAGEGFLTQSSEWMHFGLGVADHVERVIVQWPNRELTTEEFGPLAAGGRYELVQGSGVAERVQTESREVVLQPSVLQTPPASQRHRIPLLHRLTAPKLWHPGFDGVRRDVALDSQGVILVNLWSTTCKPCVAELSEFARRADELQSAGVRILALSVDALELTPDASEAASAMATRLQLPFDVGMAPAEVVGELRALHNMMIKMERPLPLPTSFLIDRQGRLDVIYKGPVEVDTLLADARSSELNLLDRLQRAAAFPGLAIDHDVINAGMKTDEAAVYLRLAKDLTAKRRLDEALVEYHKVLDREPDNGAAHSETGLAYQLTGNTAKAVEHFQQALKLLPDNPDVMVNLATALLTQDDLQGAQSQLLQALEIEPAHANAHYSMGVIMTRANNLSGARARYERALEADPRHARSHFALGNLLERSGDLANAIQHYRAALEVVPNEASIWSSLGQIYFRENNLREAENSFRSAIQARPDYTDAHFRLGLVLASRGERDEAKREFETTLRLNKRHSGAQAALQKLLAGN